MPTPAFPARHMDQKQLFNRCFVELPTPNPDQLGALRVSISGITIPPLAVQLDCTNDSVQICADNGTAIEGLESDANNHLIVSQAAPIRSVEIDSVSAADLSFTSTTEIENYDIVFIGVARTGGSEDFEVDVSVKRGTILHPIYKRAKFKDFVSITDILRLTSGEVLVVTTTGVTTSTVDLTVIKEGV